MWKFIGKAVIASSFMLASLTQVVKAEESRDLEIMALLQMEKTVAGHFTLIHAIKQSLKSQPGVLDDAQVEMDDGRLMYEVEITNGSSVYHFRYDAETGENIYQSIDSGSTLANYLTLGLFTVEQEQEHVFMSKLLQASEEIKGSILSVELEEEEDVYYFEIKSWFDNEFSTTLINAMTGKMIFIRNYQNYSYGENLLERNGIQQVSSSQAFISADSVIK